MDKLRDDILRKLQDIRLKLLDLSKRNRLLNFRRSKSCLAIVDEQPRQVFDYLVNRGGRMKFVALPEDSEGGEGSNATNDHAEPCSNQQGSLEIDVDDELPSPAAIGEESPKKHLDDKLQTRLFAQQLETRLRRMRSNARSVIEETGKNQLFLALGLLSWRDRTDTTQTYDAPLILVPVELERGRLDKRAKCYTYSVRYTGEDLVENLSLREKLKQYDLVLPDFEDDRVISGDGPEGDLDPEAYFELVNETISRLPGWQVKRRMVVGFFAFAKLLMYQDIAPELFADHSLVRILLGCEKCSQPSGLSSALTDETRIDTIPVVMDADSSQTEAIVHALNGQSMVIQGPPGTGKSQTITNLIGSFLDAGKSVLFVAEKMAALEVVYRNLERVGLSEFCLQLHSHRANKHEVIEDLKKRAKRHGHHKRTGAEVPGHLERLKSLRSSLAEYIELLKKPVGPANETVFEIFGKAELLRGELSKPPELSVDHIESLTQSDIENAKDLIQNLSRFVLELGSVRTNVWHGYEPVELIHGDHTKVTNHLRAVRASAENLQASARQLFEEMEIAPDTVQLTYAQAQSIAELDPEQIPHGLLPDLASSILRSENEDGWEEVCSLQSSVEEYRTASNGAGRYLRAHKEAAVADEDRLKEAASLVRQYGIDKLDLGTALKLRDRARRVIELVQQFQTSIAGPVATGLPVPRTVREMDKFVGLYSLIEGRPQDVSSDLLRQLSDPSARIVFTRMQEEYLYLAKARKYLEAIFWLRDVCPLEELAASRRALRQAQGKLLSRLSSEYRAAKRVVSTFVKKPSLIRSAGFDERLVLLEEFLEQESRFSRNEQYAETFGRLFGGTETDWDKLRQVMVWCTNVWDNCGSVSLTQILAGTTIDASTGWPTASHLWGIVREIENGLHEYADLTASASDYEDAPFDTLCPKVNDIISALTTIENLVDCDVVEASEELSTIVRAIDLQLKANGLRERIENNNAAASLLGPYFHGVETDIESVAETVTWAHSIRHVGLPEPMLRVMAARTPHSILTSIGSHAESWPRDLEAISTNIDGLRKFGRLDTTCFLGSDVESLSLMQLESRVVAILSEEDSLTRWADYCRVADRAKEAGLQMVVEKIETGELAPEEAVRAYLYAVYDGHVRKILREHPSLTTFTRTEYESKRDKFAELDKRCLEIWRRRIGDRVSTRNVPTGRRALKIRDWTEMCLLEREFSKKRRHLPIRRLLDRAGGAIRALKPVFMMSPMSVAQFLEQGKHTFDVVIMDEASQIQPHDALGAIQRSQQMIVVGDSKQLPPTTFFETDMSNVEDEQAEESIFDDNDVDSSILDICEGVKLPSGSLKWHYRSEHESLIAFSNAHWYDNELVVFPSSGSSSGELGIRFHRVEDATYASGRNIVEAKRVARGIIEHARRCPELSLGVGTFNLKQRDLVEDQLSRLLKEDPTGEAAVTKLNQAHDGAEPLFIKNLENLQGDERDVIFISCTFGPDRETGQVYQRFGPINGRNGPRRLNVLFTRAKRRMEVFSSMTSEQVLTEPGADGRVALKGFLKYAETGRLPDLGRVGGRSPDSDFELAVARVVRNLGYQVELQVGVAGYWVDIGVRHPRHPDEFMLGVECDGATYHSSTFARDRDRLREEVLKRRGWRIYRVWSTDWFRNRGPEIERLKKTLTELVEQTTPTLVEVIKPAEPVPEVLETAAPRLADDELKRRLFIFCRENIPRPVEAQKSDGFLQPVVLDVLVTKRITNRSDLCEYIPSRIRAELDSDDLQYLDDIFEIVEEAS